MSYPKDRAIDAGVERRSSTQLGDGECSAYLSREMIGNLHVARHCFHGAGIGIGPEGVGRSFPFEPV